MPQVPHKIPLSGGKRAAPDGEMAKWASARDGVVSRQELLALGFGRRAIESHLANGQLHVVHHGVYAVGHKALSRKGYPGPPYLPAGTRPYSATAPQPTSGPSPQLRVPSLK